MPDAIHHGAPSEEPFLEMDTEEGGKGSTTVLVLLIVISLLVVGFFVFYRSSLASQAKDKQNTFVGLMDEINSSDKQKVREQANAVESSIAILKTASKTKYSFKAFIDELTKKITNDIQVTNMSIDQQGTVTIDGASSSYRAVADLAVALESSEKISDVEIGGLTKGSEEGSEKIAFSVTGKISDWETGGKSENAPAETPVNSTEINTSVEGGVTNE